MLVIRPSFRNRRPTDEIAPYGFPKRHWTKLAAQGRIPGARQPCGPRGHWSFDARLFAEWWETGKTEGVHANSVEASRQRIERLLSAAIAWGDKPRRSWEEAAAKFIAEHFPTIKLGARRRYAVSIRHLNDHFAGKMLHQITSAEMSEFETRRRATSVSTSTIRRDLACLSSLMTSAMDSERCRAVAGEMLFEGNPIEDAADEFGQRRLAVLDGLPAKVLAIELDA
jgi:hypothetical protein